MGEVLRVLRATYWVRKTGLSSSIQPLRGRRAVVTEVRELLSPRSALFKDARAPVSVSSTPVSLRSALLEDAHGVL
jgi:hypothetical protein